MENGRVRVEIVGPMTTRAGRPSFAAMAGGAAGVIELDNSAVSKLSGKSLGDSKLAAIDGSRAAITRAASHLYATGATSHSEGQWLLLLSALDLD